MTFRTKTGERLMLTMDVWNHGVPYFVEKGEIQSKREMRNAMRRWRRAVDRYLADMGVELPDK
jgi:hypothetical protein